MLEKMLALQNKRKKEGGFTLVELIVVLVILAILAALLIPALTGYIDKAKDKGTISETRQAVMAAQTLADEDYAAGTTTKFTAANIKTLADVPGNITDQEQSGGKVVKLTYTNNGRSCTYSVSKDASNNYTGTGTYSDITKTSN